MGCTGNKGKSSDINEYSDIQSQKFNQQQCKLLRMIYEDLAMRVSSKEMNMQNFLLFFHKNGYWGDRLFKQFSLGTSNFISVDQFISGILKLFKTTEDAKIQLLYKFFSDNKIEDGISFNSFLTMLYNYPKEDFNHILNDHDFIQSEIKKNLVAINNESEINGRRLMSVCPNDMRDIKVAGQKFKLQESDKESQKIESKIGNNLIREMNKNVLQNKGAIIKLKVGENDVEIKTTSVQHLAKKYAKKVFKDYSIDNGVLKFVNFRNWIISHRNLYHDYFKGFHNQVWEMNQSGFPLYKYTIPQFKSYARYLNNQGQFQRVYLCLLNSILMVTASQNLDDPLMLITLDGLAVKKHESEQHGHGIEISHRDGVYPHRVFTFLDINLQQKWLQHLKYYKGSSINQLYQLGEQLGIGKFSIVYQCEDKATRQQYAIKVIQTHKLDEEARKLISHQTSINKILSHPLLVFFKETIQQKNHVYIITELVKGKDLFELVKEYKFLAQKQCAYIIQQIIIGVRYLHSLGIVHRDLKPENIMVELCEDVGEIGKIKLIDFGFANYISKLQQQSSHCIYGIISELWVGTPNYISPEVLRGDGITEKIDNFAIGSILYFMLSGTLPFNSYDLSGILRKTLQGEYTMHSKKWKCISQHAKDLVQKLLETDPNERISLSQALKHPWLKQFRQQKQKTLRLLKKDNNCSQASTKQNIILY